MSHLQKFLYTWRFDYFSILFLMFGYAICGQGQSILDEIHNLSEFPKSISISNTLIFDTIGGHLQGAQIYKQGDKEFAILSGSSAEVAYLLIVELGSQKVERLCTLFTRPLKHAGGFQICENYLAIGVEDNEQRTTSKVMIYNVDALLEGVVKPLSLIDREGAYQRSTAGCVALARTETGWLLMVGDWDTKHLDIYLAPKEQLPRNFKLHQTLTMQDVPRQQWSDAEWMSYQNINLFTQEDEMYLIGMTSDSNRNNILDLFQVLNVSKEFRLKKITRKVLANVGGDFISAAGIWSIDNRWHVISSDRNFTKSAQLYLYSPK